ncbi:MAG: hypothetical protein FJW39_13860 [Acidobacteria bacterium]|nr:hypothetical protein [Acidobacteriota bacterium]
MVLLLAVLDLTQASVLAGPSEKKAAQVLIEEVEQRSHVRWGTAGGGATVRLQTAAAAASPDGYRITVSNSSVTVTGNSPRGTLFGAGRLLRTLRMARGSVAIDSPLDITSAPVMRIRGHQLGNRPLNNSIDAWSTATWDQYVRDLAVFGTNAVELIPHTVFMGEDKTPHFVMPAARMLTESSRIIGEYGLDVWLWYPALEKDYATPALRDAAVAKCEEVFRSMPRLDAVFVPGGDPGDTHPRDLMPYIERLGVALRRHHPKAGLWVSPQGFDDSWLDEFFRVLRSEPGWLAGVVHGPGVRLPLAKLRERVPARYPVRLYPDITHTVRSEHPVPDWDIAYALAYDREPINPRPFAYARIFERAAPHAAGFITYSDGTNDEVNKFVWSVLGWDPKTPVIEILRDYGRYFMGRSHGEGVAQAIAGLERNWTGPLLGNAGVENTLQQLQGLERAGGPRLLANWRFQQLLFRGYFDSYLRNRMILEAGLEARAMEQLRDAPRTGSLAAMAGASRVLDEASSAPRFQGVRARLFELAAALYQSIGAQLHYELYGASRRRRASSLDGVDIPLNDAAWLRKRFAEIGSKPEERTRLAEIDAIVNWKNPGPGGYYDDLGNPALQPHLVMEPESSLPGVSMLEGAPLAWSSYANSSRIAPIKMRYTGLDREGAYRVRVVYAGENVSQDQGIRLMADGGHTVHPYMKKPLPVRPVEFDVPVEATRDGELVLAWDREITPSGRSRGAQVAEVWLMRR